MWTLYRRWPVFARPVPFFVSLVGVVVAFIHASGWQWEGTLQTGKLFVLVLFPQRYGAFSMDIVVRTLIVLAFVAATILSVSRHPPAGARGNWLRRCVAPRLRFHPTSLALGVCLMGFGLAFIFDASVALENVNGGAAAFVYFDYAGVAERPILSFLGLASLAAGAAFATVGAFRGPARPARVPNTRTLATARKPIALVEATFEILGVPEFPPRGHRRAH